MVDENMIVIARSADEARYVGQPTTESVQAALRAGTRGPFPILGRDNTELTATASPVPGTAWHVVTSAPSTAFDRQVMSAMIPTLWVGLACALLSGLGAWLLARSLRRQIQATAEIATAPDAVATRTGDRP